RSGRRLAHEHGFDQSLRDEIGETSIGSCRVSVVLYSKTEVPLFRVTRAFENILAWPHQLDYGQRKVGKMIGICSLTLDQKLVESFGIGLGGKLLALLRGELHNSPPALRGLHHASDRRDFVGFQHA